MLSPYSELVTAFRIVEFDLLSPRVPTPDYASFTLFEERGLKADKCYLRTGAVGTAQKVTLNAASQAGHQLLGTRLRPYPAFVTTGAFDLDLVASL